MPNLVDIPTVVSTLVTFFAMGGGDAAIEAIKGISVNGALKLAALKDALLQQPAVEQSVTQFQQNPLDMEARTGLERILQQALEKHAVFQQAAVRVRDVKAKDGGVAAAVISGNVTINNQGRADD